MRPSGGAGAVVGVAVTPGAMVVTGTETGIWTVTAIEYLRRGGVCRPCPGEVMAGVRGVDVGAAEAVTGIGTGIGTDGPRHVRGALRGEEVAMTDLAVMNVLY